MAMRLMSGNITMGSVYVPGYTPKQGEDQQPGCWVVSNEVGVGFLSTSGMRLLAGRDFSEHDDAAGSQGCHH